MNCGVYSSWRSFGLNYYKAQGMHLGYTCKPQFRITQYERDLIVLKRIIEYLGCGNLIHISKTKQEWGIYVSNRSHLVDIIMPFFQQHPIYNWGQNTLIYWISIGTRVRYCKQQRPFDPRGTKWIKTNSPRDEFLPKVLVIFLVILITVRVTYDFLVYISLNY